MRSSKLLLGAIPLLAFAGPLAADVRVDSAVGDHMVLQRGAAVRVPGFAEPGEVVTVELDGYEARTVAGPDGRFVAELGSIPPGGPHRLTIRGRNTLRFEDVHVGEVWLASGQSNMEWPLSRTPDFDDALAAGCEGLHLFTVVKATAGEPTEEVRGEWAPCSASSAPAFSAVGFYFGLELSRALRIPVGIIHSSWGGTPAEAWMPRDALLEVSSLSKIVREYDAVRTDEALRTRYSQRLAEWERKTYPQDAENRGADKGWARLDFDDTSWKVMRLPQYWEGAGLNADGSIWFRREVELPGDWAGEDLELELGAIDDFDRTWVNGVTVGETDARTPRFYAHPRKYRVPGRLVRNGRNVVAVRVFDRGGEGGFGGTPAELLLRGPGGQAIGLSGDWRFEFEQRLEPVLVDYANQPPEPLSETNPMSPTVLWNAMMSPLTRYGVRGAIWYQGESNAGRAFEYRTLFPTLIGSWRKAWDKEISFLFVQLANYRARVSEPGESDWAELREAQSMALALPRTGMVTAVDIGDEKDIHPRNKKEVGRRLALSARSRTYGEPIEFSGPAFASHAVEGNAVRVRFSHAAGLRTRDGEAPIGFAVAGRDRRWRWGTAWIDGESVVVMSPDVPAPVAVRYAWGDNPEVNLTNGAGLPALPFRTDDWPGITQRK
jgi:sialate O-acetylesterase